MTSDEALALAFRTGLPYVGLRDHEHDPKLDRLIPPDAARAARAVPLGVDDGHIRVAVADPDADLTELTPYLTDHEIRIALAPREEIDAVLGPPRAAGEEPGTGESHVAEASPLAGDEPELSADHEPAAVGKEAPAAADTDQALPAPPPAEPEPIAAGEMQPGTEGERTSAPEPQPDADEPTSLTAEPEPPVAAEAPPPVTEPEPPARGGTDSGAEGEVHAAPEAPGEPEPSAPVPAADEVAPDEVPSWLEPPSRKRRFLVGILIVLAVLVIAGAFVVAFLNA